MATLDPLPYWTMSRIELRHLARFEWLYKQPPPKLPARAASHRPSAPSAPISPIIELVGVRPSEYLAAPRRAALRGRTAPDEHGVRSEFGDQHIPTQITKRFLGDAILSVPLRKGSILARAPPPTTTRTRSAPRDSASQIHDVLYEESVKDHEEIDPWGFSRNEKVVVHEGVFRGIPLTVSRLRPQKK